MSAPSALRTLVVWCPDWPVLAAGVAPDVAAVVVRANRVLAATPAARAAGVGPGQRRREAQGRCPDVVVTERDEAAEARAFEPVLRAVEAFTPRIELTRPGSLAVGTRGPARYFGGEPAVAQAIANRVDRVLGARGWPGWVRVGVADGVFAATLAARATPGAGVGAGADPGHRAGAAANHEARVQLVAVGDTPAFLSPRPVATLARPELTGVLERLGLRTLGTFGALPEADVLARFGLDGQGAHRLARGLDEHPPALTDPPPELAVTTALDPPAERVDVAAFVARTLADELMARLEPKGLSCTRIAVRAQTATGEVCERLWRHEGALSAAAVADRVRWQLEGWLNGGVGRPASGVATLTLTPDEVVPALGRQLGFWGAETAGTDRAVRALTRVAGLLGPEAVTVPEWHGGRGPGEQLRLVSVTAVDLDTQHRASPRGATEAPWPGRVPPPSPAVVHPDPVSVDVVDATGRAVSVSGRGLISAAPAAVTGPGAGPTPPRSPHPPRILTDSQPTVGRESVRIPEGERFPEGERVVAWAGPWPVEERWWDPAVARRRARLQVALADGRALLLIIEGGRWWIEATYD
jgi:protein ImuB